MLIMRQNSHLFELHPLTFIPNPKLSYLCTYLSSLTRFYQKSGSFLLKWLTVAHLYPFTGAASSIETRKTGFLKEFVIFPGSSVAFYWNLMPRQRNRTLEIGTHFSWENNAEFHAFLSTKLARGIPLKLSNAHSRRSHIVPPFFVLVNSQYPSNNRTKILLFNQTNKKLFFCSKNK